MTGVYGTGVKLTWLAVLGYWVWSARDTRAAVRIEPAWVRVAAYWLPLSAAVLLLGPDEWFAHSRLREQVVPESTPVLALGLALCVLGAAVAIWSRHTLGRNWSAAPQLKRDHELVRAGPYRHVRHPIYTGLLLLFVGDALIMGDWRGFLAAAIVFSSLWRKLRVEERWLLERFGDAYAAYMRETKALVPGVL